MKKSVAERAGGRQLGGEGNRSEARLFLALREKRLQPASSPRITQLSSGVSIPGSGAQLAW